MTYTEMVAKVSKRCGLPKRKAKEVTDAVFEELRNAIGRGEKIRIPNFGTFSLYVKKRTFRNPVNGEKITKTVKTPKFKASPAYRKVLEGGK